MRVLVTGAGGFVGKHLVAELRSRNHEVIATALTSREDPHIGSLSSLPLTDYSLIKQFIELTQPDILFHMAAQSKVMKSWQDPSATISANTLGTIHLMQAMLEVCPDSRFINVGSSEEYGLAGKDGKPLTEEAACLPQNPYAVSKYAAGQLVIQLAKKHRLQAIHLRPFNHFGPGQEEGFVISDFASQIVKIEKGLISPILKVGDLSAQRDFTYCADIIDAYVSIVEKPLPNGMYNVCSGTPRRIQDILDHLLELSNTPIEIVTDTEKWRPSEVPLFVGSSRLLELQTGWKPRTDFYEGLKETLIWWRNKNSELTYVTVDNRH
ncbi:GDP-mannose 4,6-dehydratase [Paenibacillus filicis]|uniref:GDP-mannose 4,6-dehydratase n=1 Tax=Paenibacillus gyeongsangnamensis TaxID=3388067 RepID=A0ABT4QHY3_9BACL|nr:GDP-mannose 4,6-dehydratase [Paenibacillus filicis]MCZ8516492.1 GDP-mannose 4,6-dehydratase [Paenibacillus filicis]